VLVARLLKTLQLLMVEIIQAVLVAVRKVVQAAVRQVPQEGLAGLAAVLEYLVVVLAVAVRVVLGARLLLAVAEVRVVQVLQVLPLLVAGAGALVVQAAFQA
jgi:hypothetical protein